MGKRDINTLQAREEAHIAASELLSRATLFFDQSKAKVAAETPDGAVIKRYCNLIMVSADFIDEDQQCSTVEAVFPDDVRVLPFVEIQKPRQVRTITIHEFPKVIGELIALIPAQNP